MAIYARLYVRMYVCMYTSCTKYLVYTCTYVHVHMPCNLVYIVPADLREEWFQSHDPMGFIGVDRNANTAAANMHIPLSMFVQPQGPPSYYAVSISLYTYRF